MLSIPPDDKLFSNEMELETHQEEVNILVSMYSIVAMKIAKLLESLMGDLEVCNKQSLDTLYIYRMKFCKILYLLAKLLCIHCDVILLTIPDS